MSETQRYTKWQTHKLFSRWSLGLDSDICTLLWSYHRVAFSLPKHPYLKTVITYRNQNGILGSWISILTEHTILAFTIYNILLWDMSFMCAICSLGPPPPAFWVSCIILSVPEPAAPLARVEHLIPLFLLHAQHCQFWLAAHLIPITPKWH